MKAITPHQMRNKVISDLNDDESEIWQLSVSREKQRVSWGFDVPGDKDQTIYVWIDALSNYLTVLQDDK